MKYLIFMIMSLLMLPLNAQQITVNAGKYSDYYHIQYLLTSGDYSVNTAYGFKQGGQFEVLVAKEHFPIAAPHCDKDIIIRMPYSGSEKRKRALYDALLQSKTLTVTLELNPYINVLTKDPLQLALKNCNVFFRHKAGDYFDKL